uniref:Uncharacterized protein n=1 Tax=Theropithecus gelada TaxID=9565 RepID=A0A8D2K4Z5_THEGE
MHRVYFYLFIFFFFETDPPYLELGKNWIPMSGTGFPCQAPRVPWRYSHLPTGQLILDWVSYINDKFKNSD